MTDENHTRIMHYMDINGKYLYSETYSWPEDFSYQPHPYNPLQSYKTYDDYLKEKTVSTAIDKKDEVS